VRRFDLEALTVAPCQGDFDCWVKTPGVCRVHDEARSIAQAMHDADLVLAVTPITFGGYLSDLKKVLDRMICLIEPFVEKREGLTELGGMVRSQAVALRQAGHQL
jgi:multimeric flavodoxin WrbA